MLHTTTAVQGKGANCILGPINVHRAAAGGRNFEYLSGEAPSGACKCKEELLLSLQDGHLGAKLTAAYVKGVQDFQP